MTVDDRQLTARFLTRSPASLAAWSAAAAFTAYFCMYGFRKPFTAASFAGETMPGIGEKAMLVTAQVLGYMTSKFLGIRVIAETPPDRRAARLVGLIAVAEAALILFGFAPRPCHVGCLFLNGLALGMVFGLVLGVLEGRRTTEALTAGLCASFILADGVTKSVGAWLLERGITERWMPATTGFLFLPPLLLAVSVLRRIPPPDDRDVAARGHRPTMTRHDRQSLLRRHAPGLLAFVAAYFLVTIARSLRADFAPEIWRGLRVEIDPTLFSRSETLVALVVLVANGLSVLIVDNRRALRSSIGLAIGGGLIMLVALAGLRNGWLGGFSFMTLLGIGLYLPYVAVHTTIFERWIAMTQDRGNLGFLMYLADSAGYLGYVIVMLGRGALPSGGGFLRFFEATCWIVGILTCVSLALGGLAFARQTVDVVPELESVGT
ncbi:MAG: DUF5690 family protein [Isosphaeraceae bacterium]